MKLVLELATQYHPCSCRRHVIPPGQPMYTGVGGNGKRIYLTADCMAYLATVRPDLFTPSEHMTTWQPEEEVWS